MSRFDSNLVEGLVGTDDHLGLVGVNSHIILRLRNTGVLHGSKMGAVTKQSINQSIKWIAPSSAENAVIIIIRVL